MPRFLAALVALLAVPACKDDPADVSGTYTVAITNGPNGCNVQNYTEGDTSTGITMVVTQTDTAVSAEVQTPIAALALDAVLTSHTFIGSVDGHDVHMRIEGMRMFMQNTCDYTFDAVADARLTGDSLAGSVSYQAVTDGSVDCGALDGCETIQNFNGSRPPQ